MNIEVLKLCLLTELILVTKYGVKGHDNHHEDVECLVCGESLHKTQVLELACGHVYHQHCILAGICAYKYRVCFECGRPIEQIVNNIFEDNKQESIINHIPKKLKIFLFCK